MRVVYRILAILIAIGIAVQAMSIVYASAGLEKWVDEGGVLDKAAQSSNEEIFPEVIGFLVHGLNGTLVIPALAILLFLASLFTKFAGSTKWAALILLFVAIQIALGIYGHEIPGLGALHGLNAFILMGAVITAITRSRKPEETSTDLDGQYATT